MSFCKPVALAQNTVTSSAYANELNFKLPKDTPQLSACSCKRSIANRIRTCAGVCHRISRPTSKPLVGHRIFFHITQYDYMMETTAGQVDRYYVICFSTNILQKKQSRYEQDSNLRGNIPLDFESNSLTTRTS